MMATALEVTTATHDGCLVVTVVGEVDLDNAHRLRAALAEATPDVATVADLSQVTFVDSIGLSTLVRAHRDAVLRGATLVLVPSPMLVQLLTISGLDRALTISSSLAEALVAACGQDGEMSENDSTRRHSSDAHG